MKTALIFFRAPEKAFDGEYYQKVIGAFSDGGFAVGTVEILSHTDDITFKHTFENFMDVCDNLVIIGGDKAVEMSEAFTGCVSITHAVIPDTVTSCDSAFKGCTALTDIKIGAGVTSINYTFEDCTSLIDITVPSKVTEAIGAFEGCTSLKTVQGGEGLEILDETFKGCISIEELVLGENVKVMKEAFAGCTSLKKIEGLPVSVEAYRPSFTDCSSLTNITVPEITEDNEIKYDLQSDIKGCVALEKLTVLTPFSTKTDFCKKNIAVKTKSRRSDCSSTKTQNLLGK